jgi:hypothetical protein
MNNETTFWDVIVLVALIALGPIGWLLIFMGACRSEGN